MKETEFYIETRNEPLPRLIVQKLLNPTRKAILAATLVEKWDANLDKSPTQIVYHACEIADLLFDEFYKRKWFEPVPPLKAGDK